MNIGDEFKNNKGVSYKVIGFKKKALVEVEFESGYKSTFRMNRLIDGTIKDKKNRSIYGFGYKDEETKRGCLFYEKWVKMLQRCYSEKYLKNKPSYIGCTVCEEWRSFSVFKKWMEAQDWKGKELDKDILKVGNKIYSPDNCCFVSRKINCLLHCKVNTKYPTGVDFNKSSGNYRSRCNDVNGKSIHLGLFDTVDEAKKAYNMYKYTVIKELAKTQPNNIRNGLNDHAENLLINTRGFTE